MARRRTLKVGARRSFRVGDLVEVAGGNWVGVISEVYIQEAEHDFWDGEFDFDPIKITAHVQARGGVQLIEMVSIVTSDALRVRHFKSELCRLIAPGE
jgi:hypothetical protein